MTCGGRQGLGSTTSCAQSMDSCTGWSGVSHTKKQYFNEETGGSYDGIWKGICSQGAPWPKSPLTYAARRGRKAARSAGASSMSSTTPTGRRPSNSRLLTGPSSGAYEPPCDGCLATECHQIERYLMMAKMIRPRTAYQQPRTRRPTPTATRSHRPPRPSAAQPMEEAPEASQEVSMAHGVAQANLGLEQQ